MIAVTESGAVLVDQRLPESARLLALALELRRGVEAWVAAAPTTEAARERDRARLSLEYVVKKLEEVR